MGFLHVKGQMLMLLVAVMQLGRAEHPWVLHKVWTQSTGPTARKVAGWVPVDVQNHFPLGLWFSCQVGLIQQILCKTWNWKNAKNKYIPWE